MEIIYSGVSELSTAIRDGDITAVELVDLHLDRIRQYDGPLNAVVTLAPDAARARAREADEALARGESWGPLHGVPFTLKDCHATAGMRTTAGFPPLADHVPDVDGTVAERLKAAGGVLMGKTNVPPMLNDIQTDNPIFGRTSNPWDPSRTSGGSSGGAAVALATGMTPLEVGSDLGGSIRIPAHFCGVFGLKTTENRVSKFGHIPELPGEPRALRLMASIGPMARSVRDLALLYGIIAGPDGRDTEVQPVPVEPLVDLELPAMRIAVLETFPGFPISSQTQDAMRDLAADLSSHCDVVRQPPLPDLDYDMGRLFEPARMAIAASHGSAKASRIGLAAYLEALNRRDQFITGWERFFDAWDALICPVSMSTAFPHCDTGSSRQVEDQQVEYWAGNAHCKLFNYTGHPVIALPYRLDTDGLPMGFQLVGKRWSEAKLLALAERLSSITGPFRRPPGY